MKVNVRRFSWLFLMSLAASLIAMPAMADSTGTLPKGTNSVNLSYFVDSVDREFDDSGSDRELGYYLNNQDVTDIANEYISSLAGLSTNWVRSTVTTLNADVDIEGAIFAYEYGITDNLSIAVGFPYFTKARTSLDFGLNVVPGATAYGVPSPDPTYSNLAEFLIGERKNLANDFITSYGYDEIEGWSGDPGIGDVRLGAKYRYLDTEMIKSAAGLWVDFPTGEPQDEKDIADIGYGTGAYQTAAFAMVDFVPIEQIALNMTGRYVWKFPYHRAVFILDKDNPTFYEAEFATRREFGDYDLGDEYQLESELFLKPMEGVQLFTYYFYRQTESNKIDDIVIPKSIEIESRWGYGITASSVEAYLDDRAQAPMQFTFLVEPVVEGKNIEKTKRMTFSMRVFF